MEQQIDPPHRSLIRISRHAAIRAQQRGVQVSTISFIFSFADTQVYVGNSCKAHSLSRRAALRLRELRHPPHDIDRARRVTVITSPDGEVITVFHDRRGGRRYRRQMATRSHRLQ